MPKNIDVDKLDPKKYIIVKGARVHNLKNIDVAIPRNQLTIITGLSGSGKSSLAFDTLYAEGQRRYVESLSAYARQFLGRLEKPDVDYIKGISPAIAIEQKVNTRNPRSTVGTSTEIYDYLKLLFARVGRTISPVSNKEVKRSSVTDVVDFILSYEDGSRGIIYAKINSKGDKKLKEQLSILLQQGFTRIRQNDEVIRIDEVLPKLKESQKGSIDLVIDRFAIDKSDEDNQSRLADSVQTAFYEGHDECEVEIHLKNDAIVKSHFSNKFELDGIVFEEPSTNLFAFNNPYGACKTCEGFGSVIGVDEDLVIPNKNLSIYDDAIAPWRGPTMREYKDKLTHAAHKFDFPVHTPYYELSKAEKKLLWEGNKYFMGLSDFFKYIESQTYKIQYRVMLSRYRGKTVCPDCLGTRLRKDANYVKIGAHSISELVLMQVKDLLPLFEELPSSLSNHDNEIAKRLLIEITSRLRFLNEVGLGYLTLNRLSNTLSGGESQRINLATSLGSSLVGSTYILDEPSIGLHSRDTGRLIFVLKQLRNLGNTVIVVEHDEDIMRSGDSLIDIGPMAGTQGGELIFQGNHEAILTEKRSLTARYLNGTEKIEVPASRRPWNRFIEITGANENNLKNISVKFPLECLTVVTGVSGSGKSTLVKRILYPALKKFYGEYGEHTGKFDRINGNTESLADVEFVDQNPIGKSSRSNPVTYIKAYDEIRQLYAELPLSAARGYKPAHFSFNVPGGRCEVCEGEGSVTIPMQFMADIEMQCEACNGRRFKMEVQEVKYQEKSISDILTMTIDDAIKFFEGNEKGGNIERKIAGKLKALSDVGLGYVQLGQSSNTLSGGEAQRIKLAFFLTHGFSGNKTLFIFDEPTTGLHFHDIKKLLDAFNALLKLGHSLIIIEHNPEIIKCADWIIDLGPEGGDEGGNLVFEGTPEQLVNCSQSYTGQHLRDKIIVRETA